MIDEVTALGAARIRAAKRKLEEIDGLFSKEEDLVSKPIFGMIERGEEIPAGVAIQAWIRLFEMHKIRRKLERIADGKA